LREPPGPLSGQLPRNGNVLSFSLAGDGEIDLFLVAKKPGPVLDLDVARASVPLASLHGADPLPPYVRLIHDVLLGDRSLRQQQLARVSQRGPMTVPVEQDAPEIAFQGLDRVGGRSELHAAARPDTPRTRAEMVADGGQPWRPRAGRARGRVPRPVRRPPAAGSAPGSRRDGPLCCVFTQTSTSASWSSWPAGRAR
jgi:hypothetical protein